jgi:hypothetical protein
MSGTYASAEFMTVRTDKSPKAISGQKMNLNEALAEQQHASIPVSCSTTVTAFLTTECTHAFTSLIATTGYRYRWADETHCLTRCFFSVKDRPNQLLPSSRSSRFELSALSSSVAEAREGQREGGLQNVTEQYQKLVLGTPNHRPLFGGVDGLFMKLNITAEQFRHCIEAVNLSRLVSATRCWPTPQPQAMCWEWWRTEEFK